MEKVENSKHLATKVLALFQKREASITDFIRNKSNRKASSVDLSNFYVHSYLHVMNEGLNTKSHRKNLLDRTILDVTGIASVDISKDKEFMSSFKQEMMKKANAFDLMNVMSVAEVDQNLMNNCMEKYSDASNTDKSFLKF